MGKRKTNLFTYTLKNTIDEALADFPEQVKTIIEKRFGINDNEPMTLKQIGCELGLTGQRIGQIGEQALSRLKPKVQKAKDFLL